MEAEDFLDSCQSDIRNPLCYLLDSVKIYRKLDVQISEIIFRAHPDISMGNFLLILYNGLIYHH